MVTYTCIFIDIYSKSIHIYTKRKSHQFCTYSTYLKINRTSLLSLRRNRKKYARRSEKKVLMLLYGTGCIYIYKYFCVIFFTDVFKVSQLLSTVKWCVRSHLIATRTGRVHNDFEQQFASGYFTYAWTDKHDLQTSSIAYFTEDLLSTIYQIIDSLELVESYFLNAKFAWKIWKWA